MVKGLKNKRAQEEIVGFILIILIVVVIFLVILGISLRQEPSTELRESREIDQFLSSIMHYNTDCAISIPTDFFKLSELFLECHEKPNSACLNERKACDILNESAIGLLDSSWTVGPDRPDKGYVFEVNYTIGASNENILTIQRGDCSGSRRGEEFLSPQITAKMQVCS